jgi:TatD DNase family protein
MIVFDSHCHLTDARFAADLDDVLGRARAAGVAGVVTIASNLADARAAAELAGAHADVWCSAGIHPHEATDYSTAVLPVLEELLAAPRVVAIGETGLDYHYDNAPRAAQRQSFEAHLDLALRTGLPVVVHARSADADTAALIRAAGPGVRGVLHCFAGQLPLLEAGLDAGWWVSFAGMISFRNYDGAHLVRAVPADRLLAETDSPYLAPVPHRGRRNEPAHVRHVVEAMARIRDENPAELAAATTRNARDFYGID